MAYDNSNSGALFKETQKNNPKGPDYSGMINVNGTEYRVAGWKHESKRGVVFLSLKISEKNFGFRDEAPASEESDLDW